MTFPRTPLALALLSMLGVAHAADDTAPQKARTLSTVDVNATTTCPDQQDIQVTVPAKSTAKADFTYSAK